MGRPMDGDERDVAEALVAFLVAGDDVEMTAPGTVVSTLRLTRGPGVAPLRALQLDRGAGVLDDYDVEIVVRRRPR